jgi:hypothetical protein
VTAVAARDAIDTDTDAECVVATMDGAVWLCHRGVLCGSYRAPPREWATRL